MTSFFPEGTIQELSKKNVLTSLVKLTNVLEPLPVLARQAMYAAAEKGEIAQKTWDGCAWNAASKITNKGNLQTSAAVAEAWGCSESQVNNFIRVWDTLPERNPRATELLMEAINNVGLNIEPNTTRATRILRTFAYKSLDTKFHEQLANVDSLADLPGFDQNLVDETIKVLVGCSS